MKTDQTIALYLRETSKGMALEADRLRSEGGGHLITQTTRLLNERACELEAQAERLEEIVEALASGALFIVDEYLAVKKIERAISDEQKAAKSDGEPGSPLRSAQLLLEDMKKMGALR